MPMLIDRNNRPPNTDIIEDVANNIIRKRMPIIDP